MRQGIFQYIDQHIEEYSGHWQRYRERWQATSSVERGEHLPLMFVDILEGSGVKARVLDPARMFVYGECSGDADQSLLLYLPIERSQYLAPLVSSLGAIDAYRAVAGQSPVKVKWLLDCGATEQLAELIRANSVLLAASGCICYRDEQVAGDLPRFALGTKGRLDVELKVRTAATATPIIHDGILPNALWRLLWAVNSLKNVQEEVLIDGFYDALKSWEDEETKALYQLADDARPFVQQWGIDSPLLALQGLQFHYAHLLTPTCSITDIEAGGTTAVGASIPSHATAHVTFSLVPEQEPEDIFEKICCHLRTQGFADVQTKLLRADPILYTPLNDPFTEVVKQSCATIYGQEPFIVPLSAGSYPIGPLRHTLGMPVVLDLMAGPGAPERHKEHLVRQVKQLTLVMEALTSL